MSRLASLRRALLASATMPSFALGYGNHDTVLNGAARELWPTLWPMIADMLKRKR